MLQPRLARGRLALSMLMAPRSAYRTRRLSPRTGARYALPVPLVDERLSSLRGTAQLHEEARRRIRNERRVTQGRRRQRRPPASSSSDGFYFEDPPHPKSSVTAPCVTYLLIQSLPPLVVEHADDCCRRGLRHLITLDGLEPDDGSSSGCSTAPKITPPARQHLSGSASSRWHGVDGGQLVLQPSTRTRASFDLAAGAWALTW